jgi:multidrug resistance efflux pump
MTLAGARALSALDIATKELELRQHQLELQKTTVNADVSPDLLSGREAQDRQLKKKEAQIAADKAAQDLAAQKAEAALDLRVKQIDADKARATIETAEHTIAGLVVVAPSDGVTVVNDHPWTGRKLHITDQVPAGTPVVSLPDLAHGMRVRADLSDVDDGRVQVGAVGTCTLDAYPGEPIACTVDQLTPVARPKTGQGSLRRAFTVELALATSDAARMRPGMSVEVELHAAELDAALVVPRAAVMRDQTTARVQLSTGELREVALGPCDAQACAVTRGLVDGERVVIGGGP